MEIMTFDTILTSICDFFDSLIKPHTIERTNTNVIYLIFKAVAKGFEVINNVCVALSSKFDPYRCSDSDLESVAFLVGTKKMLGAKSGLSIFITNGGQSAITMEAGTYRYYLNADIYFEFELTEAVAVAPETTLSRTIIALSNEKGSFPVTQQSSIVITSEDSTVPKGLVFSCADNNSLLGYTDESNIDFRKRLMTQTDRQDSLKELETRIRNLPYVFDCKIKFNNSVISLPVGGYTIPPYNMLIVISSAMLKDEIARIVAETSIYPTVQTEDSVELKYENLAFVNGAYNVYVNRFTDSNYYIQLTYKLNTDYMTEREAQTAIKAGLMSILNTNIHKDVITSNDIFDAISSLNITGFTCLSAKFRQGGVSRDYITFNETEIAKLVDVEYNSITF